MFLTTELLPVPQIHGQCSRPSLSQAEAPFVLQLQEPPPPCVLRAVKVQFWAQHPPAPIYWGQL